MSSEREEIAGVLGEHLPRDRYRDDGEATGTYCTCGGWTGDYFADGESGPFDLHLADALAELLAARDRRVRGEALREAAGAYLHDYPEIRDDLRDRADRIEGEPRRIHYDMVFADETAAMAIARDADTGEVLAVGVDVTRPKEEK